MRRDFTLPLILSLSVRVAIINGPKCFSTCAWIFDLGQRTYALDLLQ